MQGVIQLTESWGAISYVTYAPSAHWGFWGAKKSETAVMLKTKRGPQPWYARSPIKFER